MRPLRVVVVDVDAEHPLEVASVEDQQPVETLGADGSDEALRDGVRLRRPHRRLQDPDALAAEDFIERFGVLAVAVADQDADALVGQVEAEVARLLGHPGAGWVGRAAGQPDAAARMGDEEEGVVAAQEHALNGEEVARACDFFTVETLSLHRFYGLRACWATQAPVGLVVQPASQTGAWVAQQARNLSLTGLFERVRFLIHDRDSKFAAAFDEVFHSEGIQVIHTPIRAPQANAYAERVVRTVRAECLDWLLIIGRRHLERVLRIYTAHYNRERPHRGLALLSPDSTSADRQPSGRDIKRRDRLGGLIHEYHRAAA
jgi:transposase InsO family protein